MVFKCQEDSFLKQHSSVVLDCKPFVFTTLIKNLETSIDGYEVVLEETILFPEGGGQPTDHGFINDSKVYNVKRNGCTAKHYVDKPLNIGEKVEIKVDWERRFDHMQQHSGQHLISAILEKEFNYSSVSWWLGAEVSHVELDTPEITPQQIKTAEILVNDLISQRKTVTVEVFNSSNNINGVRAKGLPEDHEGDVRVITIEDVDTNMCCGTHVTNLSQLQVIKFLGSEKSKRKNQTLLYFLVGNRVLTRLTTCLDREQQLKTLLKCTAADHPKMVENIKNGLKLICKDLQNVLKDLAILEAQKCKSISPAPNYYMLHRKEADYNFVNFFIEELGVTDIFLFLSFGDANPCTVVLCGKQEAIADLGNTIMTLLDGKGSSIGNRFRAKVNNLQNRCAVEQLLKDYFK